MTNNKQQTAVEWFLDQLIEHRIIIVNKTTYQVKYKHEILLEQAKEMGKEEIAKAFDRGRFWNMSWDGNSYYEEIIIKGNNE
jgi:hypothetical protein